MLQGMNRSLRSSSFVRHRSSVVSLLLFAFVAALFSGCASRKPFPGEVPKSQMDPLSILPVPKSVERRAGVFRIANDTRLVLPDSIEGPEKRAASAFAHWCRDEFGVAPAIGAGDGPAVVFEVRADFSGTAPEMDGYTLDIAPEEIRVTGNSPSGLYYGIGTLSAIARNCDAPEIPCARISDAPDFAFRGFYHDVTRGKVPTLDTMKRIADYLAAHKANQMQLYVEHTFAFSFAPDIPHNPDGLTAEEIRELDRYCDERRIDLVPSLQSFGHMAGVLTLPRYRHFAEIEMEPWETLEGWHPKMKGATIDTSNPEALALLRRMLDEFLPLFDSEYANVCADETYDLGEGKTKPLVEQMSKALAGEMDEEKARQMAKGRLYLRHINWLNDVCKAHGKRMMFWGDIVKKHPTLIPEIPKDAILLNWGYSYKTDFESCALFKNAGLDFYVCPGTSGWNEILNRMDNADENIRKYIAAGREYGAIGVLNTDWGDHGHYNLLAGSWHGAALGAALAWNGETDQATFDTLWSRDLLDVASPETARTLRELAFDREHHSSWITFYRPLADAKAAEKLDDAEAETMKARSAAAAALFERMLRERRGDPRDVAEFLHMARMMGLLGEKVQLVRAVEANAGAANPALAHRLERFADETSTLYMEYESLWRARNKESELDDIRAVVTDLIAEARAAARGIEG